MSTIKTLGPVAFNPMGEYSSTTQYHRLDVVIYNGVSYVALQDTLGQVPTNTTYWDALGISGADTTDFYTKSEVDGLISAISTMDLQVVQELPTEDISTTTIYLVPTASAQTNNAYDEYIYVSNNWEFIGTTQADLTGYVKNTDYATSSTGGVVKIDSQRTGIRIGADGTIRSSGMAYDAYQQANECFISKTTLENVLANRIGSINDVLDAINGESV